MFTVENMLKQLEGLPLGIPIEVDNGKKTLVITLNSLTKQSAMISHQIYLFIGLKIIYNTFRQF